MEKKRNKYPLVYVQNDFIFHANISFSVQEFATSNCVKVNQA